MKYLSHQKTRGSILVVTVMFTMVIATVTASFLHLALTESRLSNSIMYANNSLNLAEAGVEKGLNALNHMAWADWEEVASDLTVMDQENMDLGGGMIGRIRAHIIGDDMTPTVIAEGVMTMPNRPTVSRQIEVRLERRRYFANGMTSLDRIYFTGGKSKVDSFKSSLGDYNDDLGDGKKNLFDRGSVASNSVLANAMDLSNGQVFGYAAAGSQNGVKLGPQGKVFGEGDSGHSPHRVAYDYYGEFPEITAPSYEWTYGIEDPDDPGGEPMTTVTKGGTFGDPDVTEPQYFKLDGIDVSGNSSQKLEIVGETAIYVTGDIRITGNAHWSIAEGASVRIFVDGDMSISGSGAGNAAKAEDFLIFGTSPTSQTFKLGGNSEWTAAVYAPKAKIELDGGGGGAAAWYGAVVGKEIQVTGNYQFHYDEDLADFRPKEATFRMERWRELHAAADRYDFAVNQDADSRLIWWLPDL